MKLNFWQWLGLVLLVIGVFLYVRRETAEKKAEEQQRQQQAAPYAPTQPATPAVNPWVPSATQPATTPSAP